VLRAVRIGVGSVVVVEPDAAELRVLGALIEKQRTTPDAYPLSLNSLRVACNQATGRDPVVDYDEPTIRDAIARLVRRGWARLASGPGSRATKYRHLLDEALSLNGAELSLLAVLMLRGAQTPGELRVRSERLHHFATLEELDALLDSLGSRRLVIRFERRPGQKEARWSLGEGFGDSAAGEHGDFDGGTFASPEPAAPVPGSPPHPASIESRVAVLERELEALRAMIESLRAGAL
jgi:uncharacterized protein YceH (UPF0502 family)